MLSDVVLILGSIVGSILAKDDGLVLTPPMGWLAWTRFMCQIDCSQYPKHCISENLFMEMANVMIEQGYKDAGYDRVNIDDCWMAKKRDANGELQADPGRFPHGIKWLADYMHKKGLKLGIYANLGKTTCMRFPGSVDNLQKDAETFVSWDVDMLKLDGCFTQPEVLDDGYPKMGRYLNQSNRAIVYSCSWPYYISTVARKEPDYKKIKENCHLWRNFDDIQIHFKSIASIIDFYDRNQERLAPLHGPGSWNDPDMIIVGNPEISVDEAKIQMALWSIWSAPLLMSNDLREVSPEHKAILLNTDLIAVNQDKLGVMGKLVKTIGSVNIYVKPTTPVSARARSEPLTSVCSYAVAFYNKDPKNQAELVIELRSIGLKFESGYFAKDIFSNEDIGLQLPDDQLKVVIPRTSASAFKFVINDANKLPEKSLRVDSEWFTTVPDMLGLFNFYFLVIGFVILVVLFKKRILRLCRRIC